MKADRVISLSSNQRQAPQVAPTLSGGSSPSDSSLKAGTDLALAAGAFGQSVTLVLAGEALDLLRASARGDDALWRLFGSLSYYDIDAVYALEWEDRPEVLREDLNIVDMSRAEWRAVTSEVDIVVLMMLHMIHSTQQLEQCRALLAADDTLLVMDPSVIENEPSAC